MNTEELDDELDAFRECVIYLAEGCTHSEQTKKELSDLADKLEAAMDDEVRDDVKAVVLDLGELVLRATLLPPGTPIGDDLDLNLKLLVSALRGGTLLQ
jgi:hypothetical protein